MPSTAVVQANAGSQVAPTRLSAGSIPARHTVGMATAHFQIAGRLQTKQVATAGSIPASRLTKIISLSFNLIAIICL